MADFFAELKRRQIYRVGAAYVVVAWALTQGISILAQVFSLTAWIAQAVIVLLAIGFPVALIAAWMIESKPHQAVASAVASRPTMVDWSLFGALVVVLLFMGYQQLVPSSGLRQAGVDAARSASASQTGAISLAVLPFSNLSSDPEQQFFSDGMTEEITAALAKIPDLRVIARTSAFQFREQNRDIRSIGQALNASHFIEGSVRKAGSRVRITAQLIEARSGVHVWAQNFDRELADVFAVQEEIATSIAGALNMQLGLAPGQQLVSNRAIDPESYQQFLRAKTQMLRGRPAVTDVLAILEPLVKQNPDFAPAWAALAYTYYAAINGAFVAMNAPIEELQRVRDLYQPKLEAAARRAIALEPDSVDAQILAGWLQTGARRWVLVEEGYAKALRLDPNHPGALNGYSSVLLMLGRIKEAIAASEQLRELEPYIPLYAGNLADALWVDGQTDAAIALYNDNLTRPGAGAAQGLARIYASLGRYEDSAKLLPQLNRDRFPDELIRTAMEVLRSAPGKSASAAQMPRFGRLNFVYLHVGAPERVLDYYEEVERDPLDYVLLWHSSYAPVRKTERFKKIVRDAGFVEYWRAKGWPDQCRPVGADDFACS